MLHLVHISKIIRNFAVEKVMMSENKRNLTEKEEYYKLITDEKSNHIGTNANGAGSQCVRRINIGSLSFRERYLSLRKEFSNHAELFFYRRCLMSQSQMSQSNKKNPAQSEKPVAVWYAHTTPSFGHPS